MKKKSPISWKIEEYVFSAIALRDEIIRHKAEGDKWSISKSIAIRGLYFYAMIVALVMILACIIYTAVMEIFKR